MNDCLFTKRLFVALKSADRETRKEHIQIAVEIQTITTPVQRKELVIRLTDEKDLFFLYTLRLTEEDFQSLKTQQGLLVDFGAFPQKFIDLLELCIAEERKEVPKFILEFVCGGSLGSGSGLLNVIETNPFKYLTHLALKFLPGSDGDVKKHLAECLKMLKDQNGTLLHKLEHTESDLSTQLRQAREALSARTLELDNLKSEWSSKITDLNSKHKQDLTIEREKALQTQTSSQQRTERDKRELEQAHMKIVKQMESRIYEIETANKDLTDRKYKSEATIREQKAKLNTLEEENHRMQQELGTLRKDNAGLDSDYHEQDKVINQLKTRIAVAEQDIKNKEEVIKRTSDSLSTEQSHKKKLDDDLDRKQRQVHKLEISIKTMTEELVKGNEIIKKLQGEIRNYHTKLKLRSQITTEQEKLLGEKNKEMEEIRKDLEATKSTLRQKENENAKLNESLEATMQKLEESRQLLKTNENVINWLNKQVTESQMTQGRTGTFEMNSTAASTGSFKPGSTLHNFSNPSHYSKSSMTPMSTPGLGPPSGMHHSHDHHQPPVAHMQVHYNPGLTKKSALPMPLAKSSPVGTIQEERRSPHASPPHLSHVTRSKSSDAIIDPKYLQGGIERPLRTALRSASPNAIQFTSQGPAYGASTANPTRLSKDIIMSKPSSTAKGGNQVPLASAYFPNQSKVS